MIIKIKFRTFIIGLIIILLVGAYVYNSDFYINYQARKAMENKIAELNKLPKKYLNEGVYSFNEPIIKSKSQINSFGKIVSKSEVVAYRHITFSFTSNDLIIDYPYKWNSNLNHSSSTYYNVREVITFKGVNFETTLLSGSGKWVFDIKDWYILDAESNKKIYNVEDEMNRPNVIQLIFSDNDYASFNCFNGFKTVHNLAVVDTIENYNTIVRPIYSTNFTYGLLENIEYYKTRKSWKKLLFE